MALETHLGNIAVHQEFGCSGLTNGIDLTPGALSRRTRPHWLGSITASSVTISVTGRSDVAGSVNSCNKFRVAFLGVVHRDDHTPRAADQIHGATHAGNEFSRNSELALEI